MKNYPEQIKIYPLVGLKSFRKEAGGAWRLFVLAKNIAGNLDHVRRDDLKEYAKSLGLTESQWKRHITTARNLDLVKDVQRMSGEWMFILPSNKQAAELLGSEKLGQPVVLSASLLFKKGWRGFVFASWQAAYTKNGERLISQKKQFEITGINPQTQRKFNKTAGVKSTKNYAKSNMHANGYSSVLEFGNRACLFKYWNSKTHQFYLGWRIPDSRVFPEFGTNLSKSTPRKLSLFNHSQEQHAQTLKTIRRLGSEDKQITTKEIYTLEGKSAKGNNLWIHLPII